MDGTANKNYGHPIGYDPSFKGPVRSRSCTDIVWLILFGIFIAVWFGISVYAWANGDINLYLVDSLGSRCGIDSNVKDKKYLLFFDVTKCLEPYTPCSSTQICVEKCPENNFLFDIHGYFDNKYMYCVDGQVKPKNAEEAKSLIEANKCTKWVLPSISARNRCIPDIKNINWTNYERKVPEINKNGIMEAIKNVNLARETGQSHYNIIEDLESCWGEILGCIFIAFVVCLIYIILLRWIAATMVWISILCVVVLLIVCIVYSASFSSYDTGGLPLLVISSIALIVLLFVLLSLRKKINLAIALIREGSVVISCMKSTLFFPIIPLVLQIILIISSITVAIYLTTLGRYENIDVRVVPYLQAYNIFGVIWSVSFLSALCRMILASCFATWYWTYNKNDVPFFVLPISAGRTLRYHLGTLAFGSLIITICRVMRIMLEYISKLNRSKSCLILMIIYCSKGLFYLFENFLKFISKNAFIMCSIHGKNFCASARDALGLIVRNVVSALVLDRVIDFLFLLSKLLITIVITGIAYFWIDIKENEYNRSIVPVLIVALCTYSIASLFFSVYSMAVETLFLCFLEESERHDGSAAKPYFMTRNLMTILLP